jgi:hypothetical protein
MSADRLEAIERLLTKPQQIPHTDASTSMCPSASMFKTADIDGGEKE